MKKLLFLFTVLLFMSCSKEESESNGKTATFSDFGTVLSLPEVNFQKVNSYVGIWNPNANSTAQSTSQNSLNSDDSFRRTNLNYKSSNLTVNDNYVYIEDKMQPLSQEVNNIIDEELIVLSEIDEIISVYFQEFESDSFNYDPAGFNIISDSLFFRAEDLHNQAISKRNDAVEISSEAQGIQARNVANYFITEISTKINGSVTESVGKLYRFYELTTKLKDDYEVEFSQDIIQNIEEFFSVPDRVDTTIEGYNNIMGNISSNLYGTEWINGYYNLSQNPTEENFLNKINEFENYLNDINDKLELFKNYYNQHLNLELEFENFISELSYQSSVNFAKMILDYYGYEIVQSYSKMNAWKLMLLEEYLRSRAILLVNVQLWNEKNEIYNSGTGFEKIACLSYEGLLGLDLIEADANLLYPDFGYLGISFEGWPAYDKQFVYGYTFSGERNYLKEDVQLKINDFGCSCFFELGFSNCDEVITHINSGPPYN